MGARLAGRDGHAVWTVRSFVEKPDEDVAEQLRARGAVWNTFIAVGPVSAFWELAREHLPRQAAAFARCATQADQPGAGQRLEALYAALEPASWSHDVIARTPGRRLGLVSMAGSGWSDWGSPPRVFASLAGTAALDRLLARVRGSGAPGDRREPAADAA